MIEGRPLRPEPARNSSLFLDEVKTPTYVMAAVVVPPSAIGPCRESVRRLRVPGTARIHFNAEQDRVRRAFLTTVDRLATDHGLAVRLYDAGRGRELERRAAVLGHIVADCADLEVTRMVLEMDVSMRKHDEAAIKAARWRFGCHETLRYDLVDAASEPLLWIADAVAWAWRRDRHWQNLTRPLVTEVIKVS